MEMRLPKITRKTIQSFRADLINDESLNIATLLREMQKDNPELAKVIEDMSGNDTAIAGRLLCLCEIIERQLESNEMTESFQ